eukprot:gnl/MRDRNA2_/MRDRNA2_96530_c0_seq1.p1 gnl/MRDRNA2_/MRDRNA2_96530_c0~~gnl/MRDRNA2_/MRDRNA2_96530_c0_seq1.p1  ORF type:complete len:1719 (-),score=343.09 gnl/MRDRNA2_/MRDRNA2_96530_c0_seq1:149-5305(-)
MSTTTVQAAGRPSLQHRSSTRGSSSGTPRTSAKVHGNADHGNLPGVKQSPWAPGLFPVTPSYGDHQYPRLPPPGTPGSSVAQAPGTPRTPATPASPGRLSLGSRGSYSKGSIGSRGSVGLPGLGHRNTVTGRISDWPQKSSSRHSKRKSFFDAEDIEETESEAVAHHRHSLKQACEQVAKTNAQQYTGKDCIQSPEFHSTDATSLSRVSTAALTTGMPPSTTSSMYSTRESFFQDKDRSARSSKPKLPEKGFGCSLVSVVGALLNADRVVRLQEVHDKERCCSKPLARLLIRKCQSLGRAFRRFDRAKLGHFTCIDFCAVLSQWKINVFQETEVKEARIFALMDRSHDGTVNFEDWCDFFEMTPEMMEDEPDIFEDDAFGDRRKSGRPSWRFSSSADQWDSFAGKLASYDPKKIRQSLNSSSSQSTRLSKQMEGQSIVQSSHDKLRDSSEDSLDSYKHSKVASNRSLDQHDSGKRSTRNRLRSTSEDSSGPSDQHDYSSDDAYDFERRSRQDISQRNGGKTSKRDTASDHQHGSKRDMLADQQDGQNKHRGGNSDSREHQRTQRTAMETLISAPGISLQDIEDGYEATPNNKDAAAAAQVMNELEARDTDPHTALACMLVAKFGSLHAAGKWFCGNRNHIAPDAWERGAKSLNLSSVAGMSSTQFYRELDPQNTSKVTLDAWNTYFGSTVDSGSMQELLNEVGEQVMSKSSPKQAGGRSTKRTDQGPSALSETTLPDTEGLSISGLDDVSMSSGSRQGSRSSSVTGSTPMSPQQGWSERADAYGAPGNASKFRVADNSIVPYRSSVVHEMDPDYALDDEILMPRKRKSRVSAVSRSIDGDLGLEDIERSPIHGDFRRVDGEAEDQGYLNGITSGSRPGSKQSRPSSKQRGMTYGKQVDLEDDEDIGGKGGTGTQRTGSKTRGRITEEAADEGDEHNETRSNDDAGVTERELPVSSLSQEAWEDATVSFEDENGNDGFELKTGKGSDDFTSKEAGAKGGQDRDGKGQDRDGKGDGQGRKGNSKGGSSVQGKPKRASTRSNDMDADTDIQKDSGEDVSKQQGEEDQVTDPKPSSLKQNGKTTKKSLQKANSKARGLAGADSAGGGPPEGNEDDDDANYADMSFLDKEIAKAEAKKRKQEAEQQAKTDAELKEVEDMEARWEAENQAREEAEARKEEEARAKEAERLRLEEEEKQRQAEAERQRQLEQDKENRKKAALDRKTTKNLQKLQEEEERRVKEEEEARRREEEHNLWERLTEAHVEECLFNLAAGASFQFPAPLTKKHRHVIERVAARKDFTCVDMLEQDPLIVPPTLHPVKRYGGCLVSNLPGFAEKMREECEAIKPGRVTNFKHQTPAQRAILRKVAADLGLWSHTEGEDEDSKYVVVNNMPEFMSDIQAEIGSITDGNSKVLRQTFHDFEQQIVHALAVYMGRWPRKIPEGSDLYDYYAISRRKLKSEIFNLGDFPWKVKEELMNLSDGRQRHFNPTLTECEEHAVKCLADDQKLAYAVTGAKPHLVVARSSDFAQFEADVRVQLSQLNYGEVRPYSKLNPFEYEIVLKVAREMKLIVENCQMGSSCTVRALTKSEKRSSQPTVMQIQAMSDDQEGRRPDGSTGQSEAQSQLPDKFKAFATGSQFGIPLFMRTPDLTGILKRLMEKRTPESARRIGLDPEGFLRAFDETLELQIDMGSRATVGINAEYFPVFLQIAAERLGWGPVSLLNQLG